MNDKQKKPKNSAADVATDVTAATETAANAPKMFVIPKSVNSTIDSFSKLKELAYLIERHYDRYTEADERTALNKLLDPLTELNVSNLTTQLNDVEKSQAAMLIRQIIKDHLPLKRVHLQDNTFAPPELQFIVKALIFVMYGPGKKHQLTQVNLNNSINAANLERSSAEIMQLRKAYGNSITLDTPVYDHFIETYRKVTNHYSQYLAKKIILPKANVEVSGSDDDILQSAHGVIKKGLPDGTKNLVRYELAVKKFQALQQLADILRSKATTQDMFEKFQTQYKTSKKVLSKSINKDDDTHLDRLYEQIGDIKPQKFIPAIKDSRSIFKPEPKKKKGRKKAAKPVKKLSAAAKKLAAKKLTPFI